MGSREFELHFERMGLQALPTDVSCEATFAPGSHDATMVSQPRAQVTAVDAAGSPLSGTLPRLVLATPDAAREPTTSDEVELVPVAVIGEGGMGRVLLARQHSLGREVAVKVLKGNATNEGAAAALVEEARTTGSLEHPGVVPVYALARDSAGLPALVMKRVDGVSWRELIHDPAHPSWKAIATGRDALEGNLEVLIQVCNAVAYAHRRGVIHRDLKPANVLVGELGEVYVADWGVAIQRAGLKPAPPRLVGTPAYLAPEMATGDAQLMDVRTDIYLLGATLHEVLTLMPPHTGSVLREVLEKAWVAAPPKFGPDVPIELAQICTRALAANPDDRFQTVLELRDALRLFIVHRGATRLSDAAAARLKKLEAMLGTKQDETELRRWYSLVSECRFGFASALETNPNDAAARVGHERVLEVAARRELERGLAASARAFLSEMTAPPADLGQALQALEAAEGERAAREAKFQRMEHELNPEVSAIQRNLVLLAIAGSIGVMIFFFGTDRTMLETNFGRWGRTIPMMVVTIVFTVSVILARKALLTTRINRQLMGIIALGCVALQFNRVACVLMEIPVESSMVLDGITIGVIMGMCAVVLHGWFAVPALVSIIGSLIGLKWPDLAIRSFAISALIGFVLAVILYRLWQKSAAAERKAR